MYWGRSIKSRLDIVHHGLIHYYHCHNDNNELDLVPSSQVPKKKKKDLRKEVCVSQFLFLFIHQAHCRAILCEVSWSEMQRLSKTVSPNLGKVLLELAELYLTYWSLEKRGDLLMVSLVFCLTSDTTNIRRSSKHLARLGDRTRKCCTAPRTVLGVKSVLLKRPPTHL